MLSLNKDPKVDKLQFSRDAVKYLSYLNYDNMMSYEEAEREHNKLLGKEE